MCRLIPSSLSLIKIVLIAYSETSLSLPIILLGSLAGLTEGTIPFINEYESLVYTIQGVRNTVIVG